MKTIFRSTVFILAMLLWIGNAQGAYFQPLGILPTVSYRSEATAVSADGSIVVGWDLETDPELTKAILDATLWAADGDTVYLDVTNQHSTATAVSADGSIVVGRGNGPEYNAFRWTASTGMVFIGDDSYYSFALGISADGKTIVDGIVKSQIFQFSMLQLTELIG